MTFVGLELGGSQLISPSAGAGHMWDLLHEQLGCPLVIEPFCKGFTSLKVIPSSQTKSLFKLVFSSSVSLK